MTCVSEKRLGNCTQQAQKAGTEVLRHTLTSLVTRQTAPNFMSSPGRAALYEPR